LIFKGGFMRRSILWVSSVLALASTAAMAQDMGRVLSSTAIISQVSVPRQVCAQEVVQVQNTTPATKSGAGALMGGIAGGAMGNAIGNGNGRAAATLIGLFGGAILGDRIEGGSPTAQTSTTQQTVNRCSTQNFIENRTSGYQVVYEYAGKQYSVQLPQDPGPTIQLQIAPVQQVLPAAQAAPGQPRVISQSSQPEPVVVTQAQPEVIETVITSGSQYQPFLTAPAPVVVFSAGHGYRSYGHRGGHRGAIVVHAPVQSYGQFNNDYSRFGPYGLSR
jgi:uncharacterized protein YcfJ